MRRAIVALGPLLVARAAAEPTGSVVGSETIEITELRVPRLPSQDPASVIVLERAELERSPSMLTDDVIRMVPSVAMFRRSSSLVADPTSQGLNLRGLGPSGVARALVIRDGIPQNDPFGGWVYWRAIPIGSIERIVIQPSGASVFGNFGLGGALVITSRPIRARTVEAMIAGGSYGTLRAAARGAHRLGGLAVELDGELVRSDGFVPIAPHDRGAVDGPAASAHRVGGIRVEHVTGRSTVRGFGRVFDEDLDAGTLYTTARVRTGTYGASWRLAYPSWRLDASAFGGHQVFEQARARVAMDRATAAPASTQRTPSTNQGASAMWTSRVTARHTLQIGMDAVRVDGMATDRLTPMMLAEQSVVERSAGGEQRFLGTYVQDSIRATASLALGASLRVDSWQQLAGQRQLVRASGDVARVLFDDRRGLQVSPRLGALQQLSEELALRGSVYRAFRAPTLNELYRPFQVGTVLTAANAQLRPEVLWGGELGPQVVVGTLTARATAFWNRLSSPISNVTLATPVEGAGRMRKNLGRARVAGLEARGELAAARGPVRHRRLHPDRCAGHARARAARARGQLARPGSAPPRDRHPQLRGSRPPLPHRGGPLHEPSVRGRSQPAADGRLRDPRCHRAAPARRWVRRLRLRAEPLRSPLPRRARGRGHPRSAAHDPRRAHVRRGADLSGRVRPASS